MAVLYNTIAVDRQRQRAAGVHLRSWSYCHQQTTVRSYQCEACAPYLYTVDTLHEDVDYKFADSEIIPRKSATRREVVI